MYQCFRWSNKDKDTLNAIDVAAADAIYKLRHIILV